VRIEATKPFGTWFWVEGVLSTGRETVEFGDTKPFGAWFWIVLVGLNNKEPSNGVEGVISIGGNTFKFEVEELGDVISAGCGVLEVEIAELTVELKEPWEALNFPSLKLINYYFNLKIFSHFFNIWH
jgi:hypothetical protein